jgi:tRNA(Arg) A34 adenosine deaminase TadA
MRQTGISTVIFGMSNNQVGGANSNFPVLSDPNFPAKFPPPEIRTNILPEECHKLWQEFLERRARL